VTRKYTITPELIGLSPKRLYIFAFPLAIAIIVAQVFVGRRWPSATSHDPVSEVLFVLTTVGLMVYHATGAEKRSTYTLEISDDSITANGASTTRSIKKDEVRSLVEKSGRFFRRPGLLISKRSRFGSWFLGGGIWIPKALPEYEQIRKLVLSWKNSLA
jgi:hypothetical protein